MSVVEGEETTVGQHMLELLGSYFDNGAFTPVTEAYQELVRDRGLSWTDTMPELPRPHQELQVAGYLAHTNGDYLPMHASCSTMVSLDDEGRLVLKGQTEDGSHAEAVLDVNSLVASLQRLDAQQA